jgi:hypothetical protein
LDYEPWFIPFPEEIADSTHLTADAAVVLHNPHGAAEQGRGV